MPSEIKDPAKDLLKRMLEKDPEKRITVCLSCFGWNDPDSSRCLKY